jgi:hypothetical protein
MNFSRWRKRPLLGRLRHLHTPPLQLKNWQDRPWPRTIRRDVDDSALQALLGELPKTSYAEWVRRTLQESS